MESDFEKNKLKFLTCFATFTRGFPPYISNLG